MFRERRSSCSEKTQSPHNYSSSTPNYAIKARATKGRIVKQPKRLTYNNVENIGPDNQVHGRLDLLALAICKSRQGDYRLYDIVLDFSQKT